MIEEEIKEENIHPKEENTIDNKINEILMVSLNFK